MQRLLVWLGLLILCIFSVYVIYIGTMNYKGYCFAQSKYLNEDEKIRVAVQDDLKKYPTNLYWKRQADGSVLKFVKPVQTIPYQDTNEFLKLNPQCCAISSVAGHAQGELHGSGFETKVTGVVSSFVAMNYLIRYTEMFNVVDVFVMKQDIPISNCGKPVRWFNPLNSTFDSIFLLIKNWKTL